MLKLTDALKSWLVDKRGIQADADDDTFRDAAGAALAEGELDAKTFTEVMKDPEAERGREILDRLTKMEEALTKATAAVEAKATSTSEPPQKQEEPPVQTKASVFERMFTPEDEEADDRPVVQIRDKGAHTQYDATRKSATYPLQTKSGRAHPFAGQRVIEGQRYLDEPSELDKAISGAYIKWSLCGGGNEGGVPRQFKLTDHDMQLMQYALHEMKWVGVIHGEGSEVEGSMSLKHPTKLTPMQIKAVLDDNTSGGLEVAPIAFDDDIIRTPLLNGEVFPLVKVVNITRGRRIEGASIGNVTLGSSTEGTAITLFNTASFIAAFDTTIFVVAGAIEIGLDFLSDSPVDVAGIVTETYGQQLLTWLDNQIQNGDGTTEPEGIRVAAGTVSVNATNGAGGPPTVNDYEALLFGVAKQYKQGYASNRIAYCATETTYRRARAIFVSATDARRIFGMTHEDYMLLGHPYKIQGNHTNRQITFCNYARYRLYRRLGLTVKRTTEGYTLTRANTMLITARARFGGNLEDGNACAYCADAQS